MSSSTSAAVTILTLPKDIFFLIFSILLHQIYDELIDIECKKFCWYGENSKKKNKKFMIKNSSGIGRTCKTINTYLKQYQNYLREGPAEIQILDNNKNGKIILYDGFIKKFILNLKSEGYFDKNKSSPEYDYIAYKKFLLVNAADINMSLLSFAVKRINRNLFIREEVVCTGLKGSLRINFRMPNWPGVNLISIFLDNLHRPENKKESIQIFIFDNNISLIRYYFWDGDRLVVKNLKECKKIEKSNLLMLRKKSIEIIELLRAANLEEEIYSKIESTIYNAFNTDDAADFL